MTAKRALYLGRFNIFHNGHLSIIKQIADTKDVGSLVIGIGSAQYSRNNPNPLAPSVINPFTCEERQRMLEMSLEGTIAKAYEIVGIPDVHICEQWFGVVMKSAKPDVLYTNTKREITLFENHGVETRRFSVKDAFHAQIIREMIAYGNNWKEYVPLGTQKFVKEYKIDVLLHDFYESHKEDLERVHALQKRLGIKEYEKDAKY